MKATVVHTWVKTLEELYGENMVQKHLNAAGIIQEELFFPLSDIPDEKVYSMIKFISEEVKESPQIIWRKIGRKNIATFSQWFPSFFDGRKLRGFLVMMDKVHEILTKMIPGAKPPRLLIIKDTPFEVTMRYESHRKMYDYFLGLLEGSREFFKEEMSIEKIDEGSSQGKNYMTVKLKFNTPSYIEKKFPINLFLSLGFIRSIPAKLAIATGAISIIVSMLLSLDKPMAALYISFPVAIAVYILTVLLLSPLKSIGKEIKEISNLKFQETFRIKTHDLFEELMADIIKVKKSFQEDLLFLKGGTDDLANFSGYFTNVANNMKRISDEISQVVEDVAQGAVQQAEETENAVNTLDSNIKGLNLISNREEESKSLLAESTEHARKVSDEVSHAINAIEDTLKEFEYIRLQSEELAKSAGSIMEIVNTVEKIADQTNLLSLNAAIEAARAGDSGRGFAVVANEVRTLADESKLAVKKISQNLQDFSGKVLALSEHFAMQFEKLKKGGESLNKAGKSTALASQKNTEVTKAVVTLIEQLNSETEKIKNVVDNLHSLAAISQENSASSEEMSASITDYSGRIKELTGYIAGLEGLSKKFREQLRRYTI